MEEKKWFFPKNVDNKYKVFLNLTLGELVKFLIPAAASSVLIAFIPPYSSVFLWILKLIFIVVIISTVMIYTLYRPVADRENIRTKDFLKEFLEFKDSQKIFFKKPRDRMEETLDGK